MRNVGWNLVRQGGTMAMSFFLTPILVHGLGKDGYALYSLIGVLLGLIATLVIGAGGATVRLGSEAAAQKDTRRLWELFRWSVFLHAAGPLLAGAILAAAAPAAASFFAAPEGLAETSVSLFRWVAVGAVCYTAGQAGIGMLMGMDRFDLTSLFESALALGLLGGSAFLAWQGRGLDAIGPWFAAVNGAVAAMSLTAACLELRGRRGETGPHRSLSLGGFLKESFPFFLTNALWVGNFQTDKVFVAALLPLSSLTYYVIPFSIVQRLESLPRSVSFAAFHMAGELSGLGKADALRRLYLKGTKLIAFALLPAVVLLFALAPQFLTLWLGAEFSDHGTWPFRILLAGFSFYFLALTALSIAQGMGKAYYAVYTLAASGLLAVGIWAAFIPRYGVLAAAGGFLAAQAVATAGLLFFFHRDVMKVGFVEFFTESLLAPFASGSLLLVAAMFVHPAADTWPRLIVTVACGLALSFAASLALLDGEEKNLLRRILKMKEEPA